MNNLLSSFPYTSHVDTIIQPTPIISLEKLSIGCHVSSPPPSVLFFCFQVIIWLIFWSLLFSFLIDAECVELTSVCWHAYRSITENSEWSADDNLLWPWRNSRLASMATHVGVSGLLTYVAARALVSLIRLGLLLLPLLLLHDSASVVESRGRHRFLPLRWLWEPLWRWGRRRRGRRRGVPPSSRFAPQLRFVARERLGWDPASDRIHLTRSV